VGDSRTIPTDGVGHILLREFEFRDQALVTARLVHWGKIIPLEVLDQGECQERAVIGIALHRRDPLPPKLLAGAQPALPRDELVGAIPALSLTNHDRL